MISILFIIVFIFAVWLIRHWILQDSVELANNIPSNKLHTLLMCGKLPLIKDVYSYVTSIANTYGINSVCWFGPCPFFLTSDPVTIKDILLSENCISKKVLHNFTLCFGIGLLSANEPDWSRHRKVMNKAFSNKMLLSFLTIFNKEADKMIQQIEALKARDEKVINMLDLFHQLTLKSTTTTILKRDLDKTNFDPVIMLKHLNRLLHYTFVVAFMDNLKMYPLFKRISPLIFKDVSNALNNYTQLIDESCKIAIENDTKNPTYSANLNSVLDYVLNGVRQNILKAEEIHGEVIHLFLAAFETTAKNFFMIIIMLAMHPEYQERAYQELQTVLNDNSDQEITLEIMERLTYLDMIINETMRLLPVIPMALRNVSNVKVLLSNGIVLPKGQRIAIDIMSLHRNKMFWGDKADSFNPDNFLASKVAERHPYTFIPFLKGQRNCIGSKYALWFSKVTVAKLIKTYKFSTDFKYENLRFENHISLDLVEEPIINIERRN